MSSVVETPINQILSNSLLNHDYKVVGLILCFLLVIEIQIHDPILIIPLQFYMHAHEIHSIYTIAIPMQLVKHFRDYPQKLNINNCVSVTSYNHSTQINLECNFPYSSVWIMSVDYMPTVYC